MSDENLHKDVLKARKEYKREYMREYMRTRRRSSRIQPSLRPQDLHGPVAPANLPRTDSAKALLQAHYAHVLTLFSETGKELATLKDADEMLLVIDSLTLENKNLQDEVKDLQEALKTCQGNRPQGTFQQALKPCQDSLQEPLPPPLPTTTKPPEPGFVDPDRRPSSADDPPAPWMM